MQSETVRRLMAQWALEQIKSKERHENRRLARRAMATGLLSTEIAGCFVVPNGGRA